MFPADGRRRNDWRDIVSWTVKRWLFPYIRWLTLSSVAPFRYMKLCEKYWITPTLHGNMGNLFLQWTPVSDFVRFLQSISEYNSTHADCWLRTFGNWSWQLVCLNVFTKLHLPLLDWHFRWQSNTDNDICMHYVLHPLCMNMTTGMSSWWCSSLCQGYLICPSTVLADLPCAISKYQLGVLDPVGFDFSLHRYQLSSTTRQDNAPSSIMAGELRSW